MISAQTILREPSRIISDLFNFLNTSYKKPVSFICNFILPYQSLRIKIDAYLTKIYQKKFISLEKDPSKKKQLEKLYQEGVINIENFYNFENTDLLKELIDKVGGNFREKSKIVNQDQKELDDILLKIKQKNLAKMIYYLSFLRGENLDADSMRINLASNKEADIQEELHTDGFSHSPKAFIYIYDVDLDSRPFLYLISSHKDYMVRNSLEKITNKSIYFGYSKFNNASSRIKENINFKNEYLTKYRKFTGTVKAGSVIFVDTAGFHAKSTGSKPRYTIQISTFRNSLINKMISIFKLKKFIIFN